MGPDCYERNLEEDSHSLRKQMYYHDHLYLLLFFELHTETSYSVMIANVASCNVMTFGYQPLCVSVPNFRVTLVKSVSNTEGLSFCPKTVMSSYFVMALDNSAIVPKNEVMSENTPFWL